MAHLQQMNYCKSVVERFPKLFTSTNNEKRVLDCGSLDINGNNRFMFPNFEYIGIDVAEGKNVDIICPIHEYDEKDESFDAIVSTECFEHDMFYEKSLQNIVRLLKSGGIFVFTCATTGRPVHGTATTNPHLSPLLQGEWANYYKNITADDVRKAIDVENIFSEYEFIVSHEARMDDLYFYGIKK